MSKLSNLSALGVAAIFMAACTDAGTGFQASNPDYDRPAVTALARTTLAALQEPSFRLNREHCGYIGLDPAGNLKASPATQGRPSSCAAVNIPSDWVLVASYHTHGAYDQNSFSEVPSSTDIEGDNAEGTNGYVSTPGGRFWFINGAAQRAYQICGVGCLRQDKRYVADRPVESAYTLTELSNRENSDL